MSIPGDYVERVYAGILGKLIGVYLGRPFEGWTHARILKELGPIKYYVHERFGVPLVVSDDDVAGTFTFPRALEDSGISGDLTSREIGEAWLNYIVENRSILWWGGNGVAAEHTAWLNLKKGIPAPESGSASVNGKVMAEQIGAQIFIDCWAMVAPDRPELAARLAEQAARVSHDGEAVNAAVLWAAMEARAFGCSDPDELIETGLSFVPRDCEIAKLIFDVRNWCATNSNWQDTFARIEKKYGYDKYPGNCHVVPNHAVMIMSLLHSPDDFGRAQTIVNSSGWDTDCNAGNVGCLLGIMLGLEGLEPGPDWRGPIGDRMLISSADGGNSINDAVRMAYYIANLGRQLNGQAPLTAPKRGAQFHFSLPGSTQGFRIAEGTDPASRATLASETFGDSRALAIRFKNLGKERVVVATTPTFVSTDILRMRTYDLLASPLVNPGQKLFAKLHSHHGNHSDTHAWLRICRYGDADCLETVESEPILLRPGRAGTISWKVPQCGGFPICQIGIAVSSAKEHGQSKVLLDAMGWEGPPDLELLKPAGTGTLWRRAWVDACQRFTSGEKTSFHLSQDSGVGVVMYGTGDWTDYGIRSEFKFENGRYAGLAIRMRGLRRYYAAIVRRCRLLEIVRVRDGETALLAAVAFDYRAGDMVTITLEAKGNLIFARANGFVVSARDDSEQAFSSGGIGILVKDGAVSANSVRIYPVAS